MYFVHLESHGQAKEKLYLPSVSFHAVQFHNAEIAEDESFWKLVLFMKSKMQCFCLPQ